MRLHVCNKRAPCIYKRGLHVCHKRALSTTLNEYTNKIQLTKLHSSLQVKQWHQKSPTSYQKSPIFCLFQMKQWQQKATTPRTKPTQLSNSQNKTNKSIFLTTGEAVVAKGYDMSDLPFHHPVFIPGSFDGM